MITINTKYDNGNIKGKALTVGELIKELEKFDSDYYVGIDLIEDGSPTIHTYNILYVEMGVHMDKNDFDDAIDFKSVSIVYDDTIPPLVSEY